jgi:hypothetical protein
MISKTVTWLVPASAGSSVRLATRNSNQALSLFLFFAARYVPQVAPH